MHLTRCFILSRPADLEMARMCQAHMAGHGWTAHVLIDPREWAELPHDVVHGEYSTLGKGMYGNDCAASILDAIAMHSFPGERIVKTDCDVWLSAQAASWLAEKGPARAMNVFHRRWQQWGGCWAADREHVTLARSHADTLARCDCAESFLNLCCLHSTGPKCQAPEWAKVMQWDGGEKGFAATLPIHLRRNRLVAASALFGE